MNYNELHEYLIYSPTTGLLTWKKKVGRASVGKEAGYVSQDGYRYFGFKGKTLKTHRAIYLMVVGELPKYIDHIDHDRLNNRWNNLRGSSMTENNRNCKKQINNKSGVVGVSWSKDRKRWVAMIWHNAKPIPLGRFTDKDEAIKARKAAEVLYGYHPNHGG